MSNSYKAGLLTLVTILLDELQEFRELYACEPGIVEVEVKVHEGGQRADNDHMVRTMWFGVYPSSFSRERCEYIESGTMYLDMVELPSSTDEPQCQVEVKFADEGEQHFFELADADSHPEDGSSRSAFWAFEQRGREGRSARHLGPREGSEGADTFDSDA